MTRAEIMSLIIDYGTVKMKMGLALGKGDIDTFDILDAERDKALDAVISAVIDSIPV